MNPLNYQVFGKLYDKTFIFVSDTIYFKTKIMYIINNKTFYEKLDFM